MIDPTASCGMLPSSTYARVRFVSGSGLNDASGGRDSASSLAERTGELSGAVRLEPGVVALVITELRRDRHERAGQVRIHRTRILLLLGAKRTHSAITGSTRARLDIA